MATEINLENDDVTVNSITGNGSGLTNLNGNNVSSGTVAQSRLPFSILDEDNMGSNSATDVPSQQSVKAYVDANAGGVTLEAVKAFLSASSTVNNNTTYTDQNIFPTTGSLDINVGSFTSSSSGIVVPSTGVYIVAGNMVYNTNVARANPEWRFTINGTGQSESSLSSYIRSASGHNESSSSLTTIYNLSSGDEIGLEFRQQGNSGTVNLEDTSHVMIYRIL